VINRWAGSAKRARLSGSSSWAMTCSASAPRQPFFAFRVVLGEEHRFCGKCCVPMVLADSGEEAVEQPDVGAAALGMDAVAAQVGEVAFQRRAVDSVDALDADVGEEPGEAGEHDDRSAAAGFQAEPGRQPPPHPAFGRLAQPGLRDSDEPQCAVAVVAESTHPPGIARVLGLPAASLGQVGDHPGGVAEESAGASVIDGQPSSLVAGFFVVVEQRVQGRGGECPDHAHDHVGGELALPVVVPALQNVLQFQLQLRAQPVELDHLAGQRGLGGEAIGELVDFGSPVHLPGVGVGLAERRGRLRPELAVRDAAGRARRGLLDRLPVGQPRVQLGPAGTLPSLRVQTAHTAARRAVTAARHADRSTRRTDPSPGVPGRPTVANAPDTGRGHGRFARIPRPDTRLRRTPGPLARIPGRHLRNSLRTLAISLPTSPDETGRLQRRRGHSCT
jgi:hypothetical protein